MKKLRHLTFFLIFMFIGIFSVNAASRYKSELFGGGSVIGGSYNNSCSNGEIKLTNGLCVNPSGSNINFGSFSIETYDNLFKTDSDSQRFYCYSPSDVNQDGSFTGIDVLNLLQFSISDNDNLTDDIKKMMLDYYNDSNFVLNRLKTNGSFSFVNSYSDTVLNYYTSVDNALVLLQLLNHKISTMDVTIGNQTIKQYSSSYFGHICHLPLKQNVTIEKVTDSKTGAVTEQSASLVESKINGKTWKYPKLYLKMASNYIELNMPTVTSSATSGVKVGVTEIDNDIFAGQKLKKANNNVYVVLKWEVGSDPEILVYGISLSQFDKVLTTEMPVTYATVKNLGELQALYLTKTSDEIKDIVKRGDLSNYVSNETLSNYLTNSQVNDLLSGKLSEEDALNLINKAIDNMKKESSLDVTDGVIYINGNNTGIKVCNAENKENCPKDSIGVCPNNPEALCVNGQEVFKIITGASSDIKYEDNCLVLNGEKTVCNGNANVKIENNCIIVGNDKLCVDKSSSSSTDIEFKDNCYYRNGKLDICKVSTSPVDSNNTGTVSNPKTGIGMLLYFIVPSLLVVGFSIFYKRYRKQKYEI